jgi:aspartyl-tRNA(Asn)/glutamyl-tRNA(Gln) amidotransferase subunit C
VSLFSGDVKPAAGIGQFKDYLQILYTGKVRFIRATNRFDSPAPVRLVCRDREREEDLNLTDMEFGDLEALARVDLEPDERDRLRFQLERILGFVRKLQDEEKVPADRPVPEPVPSSPPAADVPVDCIDRDEVLGQAPDHEDGFFRVPAVIERDGGGS